MTTPNEQRLIDAARALAEVYPKKEPHVPREMAPRAWRNWDLIAEVRAALKDIGRDSKPAPAKATAKKGPVPVFLTTAERKVLRTAAGFLDAGEWDETISEREHDALVTANAKLEQVDAE